MLGRGGIWVMAALGVTPVGVVQAQVQDPAQDPMQEPIAEPPLDPPPRSAPSASATAEQTAEQADQAAEAARHDFRFVDANSDRVLLTPTAETHPEGTLFFTSRAFMLLGLELVILEFGYAVTDHLQLSLTAMPPLFEGRPTFFEGAAEANVLRNDEVRLAGIAAFELLVMDGDPSWGLRLAGVGTLCFGETCQSNVSAGVATILNDDITDHVPFAFHLGAIARISEVVALLAEPIFLGVLGEDTEVVNGMLLGYGVRVSGARWGLDLGFVKLLPFEDSDIDDGTLLGWPLLSFTYRTDGASGGSPGAGAGAPAPSPTADGTPRGAMIRSLAGF